MTALAQFGSVCGVADPASAHPQLPGMVNFGGSVIQNCAARGKQARLSVIHRPVVHDASLAGFHSEGDSGIPLQSPANCSLDFPRERK